MVMQSYTQYMEAIEACIALACVSFELFIFSGLDKLFPCSFLWESPLAEENHFVGEFWQFHVGAVSLGYQQILDI